MTEKIPETEIGFKATDFIPFVGLFARKISVARKCSSLERRIRKDHGLPEVPTDSERYENLPNVLLDWRERQVRTNEGLGEFKFDLYHLATTAIPLVYAIVSSYQ